MREQSDHKTPSLFLTFEANLRTGIFKWTKEILTFAQKSEFVMGRYWVVIGGGGG